MQEDDLIVSIGQDVATCNAYKDESSSLYNFHYVMGFAADKELPLALEGDVQLIHVTTEASAVEMVLAKGLSSNGNGWSDEDWDRFVEQNVDGKLVRVQTSMSLQNDGSGVACIDRIIDKHFSIKSVLKIDGTEPDVIDPDVTHHEHTMFDYYRGISGERMHYLDTRPWRMSTMAVLNVEYELHTMVQSIAKLALLAIETGARIQYTQEVLQCARILANSGDSMSESMIRMSMVEMIEDDLSKLESQEADIISETSSLHALANRHNTVLNFQQRLQNSVQKPSKVESKKRARDE